MLLAPWGGNQFTPLLVHYRALGVPDLTVDLLLGVYVLGIIPSLLLGGQLADRFGRKALLLPVAPFSAVGSLLLVAGPDIIVAMVVGRLLHGLALGLAMGVGTTWMIELSAASDPVSGKLVGARRAGVTLTLGLLGGAAVAGAWAQVFTTAVEAVYVLQAVLVIACGASLLRVPDYLQRDYRRRGRGQTASPSSHLGRRVFLIGTLPTAPWVFACASAAYAVLPARMSDQVQGTAVGFSALVTVLTLASGVVVQGFAKQIVRGRKSAGVVPMAIVVVGMTLAGVASAQKSLLWALGAVLTLGAAYGLLLASGLSGLARFVPRRTLAKATAVYYSTAYVGFLLPALFSGIVEAGATYPQLFTATVLLASIGLVIAFRTYARHTGGSSG